MRWTRWAAGPAVAAAVLAGAGSLYAAGVTGKAPVLPFGTPFWAAVAAKVGVPAAKLEAAVEAEFKAQGSKLFRGGFRGGKGGPPPGGATFGSGDTGAVGQYVMRTAAQYIGVAESQLLADIAKGQSMDQVAAAHGKSAAGLAGAEDKALGQVLSAK